MAVSEEGEAPEEVLAGAAGEAGKKTLKEPSQKIGSGQPIGPERDASSLLASVRQSLSITLNEVKRLHDLW